MRVRNHIFPVFLLLPLLYTINAFGQKTDPGKEVMIEQRVEQIAENNEDSELDYTNLLEQLYWYIEHPLNLNQASREEMDQMDLLTDIQINNLIKHREENGKLMTVYELQAIDGFDPENIRKLMPYIRVEDNFYTPHLDWKELQKNGSHQLFLRGSRFVESQKAYSPITDSALAASPNSRYLGDPYRAFARYRFTYSNVLSWGVTGEKDAGEEFFKGTQKNGFDFYSAHAFVRNYGKIKALALGDFHAQFGQGLTLWSGQGFGKTADPMLIKRNARGITPYASINENLFFRGAAATIQLLKGFEATALFSRQKIDGNAVVSDTTDNFFVQEVSSLPISGLHRTPGEVADKNNITSTQFGGRISYRSGSFQTGITHAATEYSAVLNRDLSFYNQFEFTGKKNSVTGIDYNYVWRNFNFFGETARSLNGKLATVNGAIISLDPKLSVSVLYRNLDKAFQPVLSNIINEATLASNEKGLLTGLNFKPTKTTSLTGYFDRFTFPWLRNQVNAPSRGYDYLLQFNYTPSKKLDLYVRVRSRQKEKNISDEDLPIEYLQNTLQTNYRFNVSYAVSPSVKLRNRVEVSRFTAGESKPEEGYLVYQDVVYKAVGSKLSFSFRYALFSVTGYNARIYTYENSVLYAFSIPSFYGKGSRTYLTLNYDLTRKIEVWLRCAQTFYTDRQIISEGSPEEINRPHKTEIMAQVRFKF